MMTVGNRKTCLLLALNLSMFSGSALSQAIGSIQGKVVDDNGHALAGAQVQVDAADGKVRADFLRYQTTDKNGLFKFDRLAMGQYRVFAKKEADGFPDTSFAFYSNHSVTKAILTRRAPNANVIVKVTKGGRLLGTIRSDAYTQPSGATFELRYQANPKIWFTTAFRTPFQLLVPPHTDIVLKIRSTGYADWYYPGTSDPKKARAFRIAPGEEKELQVVLNELVKNED